MSAEHSNLNPDLEKYLENLVAEVTEGNEEVAEEVKSELRSHLLSLVDDFRADGFPESDAVKKAIMTFGDSNIISRSLSTTLNRKTWLAQALIQHLCLWIFFSLIFRDLNTQLNIPFINYFAALIPAGISFLFSVIPSISITSDGIKLKTKFGKTTDIPLDKIKSIEYEKGHLFGKRNIVITLNDGKKHKVPHGLWGLKTSIKYIASKRPEVIPHEILEYISKIQNIRMKEFRWLSILFSAFLFILSGIVVYGAYQYHCYGILPLYYLITLAVLFILFLSIWNAVDLKKSMAIVCLLFLNIWQGGVAAYLIFSYNQGLTYSAGFSAIILFISAFVLYLPKVTKKQLITITFCLGVGFAGWYGLFNYIIYPEQSDYTFIEKKEFDNAFCWYFLPHKKGNSIIFTVDGADPEDEDYFNAVSILSMKDGMPDTKIIKIPNGMRFENFAPSVNENDYIIFLSKDNPEKDTLPYPERESVPYTFKYFTQINPDTNSINLDKLKILPKQFNWSMTGAFFNISDNGQYLYALSYESGIDPIERYFVYDIHNDKLIHPENKEYQYNLTTGAAIDEDSFICSASIGDDEEYSPIYTQCRIEGNAYKMDKTIPVLENRTIWFYQYPYVLEAGEVGLPIVRNLQTGEDHFMDKQCTEKNMFLGDYFDMHINKNGFIAAYPIEDDGKVYMNIYNSQKSKYTKIEIPKTDGIFLPKFSPDGKKLVFYKSFRSERLFKTSSALTAINMETKELSYIYRYGKLDSLFVGFLPSTHFPSFAWSPDSSYLAFSYSTVALEKKNSFGIGIWKVPETD